MPTITQIAEEYQKLSKINEFVFYYDVEPKLLKKFHKYANHFVWSFEKKGFYILDGRTDHIEEIPFSKINPPLNKVIVKAYHDVFSSHAEFMAKINSWGSASIKQFLEVE